MYKKTLTSTDEEDPEINYRNNLLRTAFHEAGHATALYLNNRANHLPTVSFKIKIRENNKNQEYPEKMNSSNQDKYYGEIEGGRLIHSLPLSDNNDGDQVSKPSSQTTQSSLAEYEADIINLLAGPLAEAKFVSLCDDEIINPHLVNFTALKYYGGASDMSLVNQYLDCFSKNDRQRKEKKFSLLVKTFDFINDAANWQAITATANYILKQKKSDIGCEEVVSIVDAALPTQ